MASLSSSFPFRFIDWPIDAIPKDATKSPAEVNARRWLISPEDKYNKLKESNPLIDLLRSKLDLDI